MLAVLLLLLTSFVARAADAAAEPAGNWTTPLWKPNWNLTESTVIEPSSPSGYFAPNHTFGLVSLDGNVGRAVYVANGKAHSNQTAVAVDNCRVLKAAGKASKCFIYFNMELALEWVERGRDVMSVSSSSSTPAAAPAAEPF